MSSGFVHAYQRAGEALPASLQAVLLRQGLGLRLYTDLSALCDALARVAVSDEPQFVLLADTHEFNCLAAKEVRRHHANICVVALQSSIDGAAVAQAVGSGIDACWPQDMPVQRVVEGVQRFIARQRLGAAGTALAVSLGDSVWRLESRAWVILSPQGVRVSLTTAERALVLALCKAPARRASHLELMRAVAGSQGADSQALPVHQQAWPAARRLSVLVSRLRHKFAVAGVEAPIRSLRSVGYELSVELDAQGV